VNDGYWSKSVRDAWFFGALGLSALSVVWLFWPYVYVLLFAVVTVVVCYPVYTKILGWVGGRALLASLLTTGLLAFLVFVPLAVVVWLFALEVRDVSAWAIQLVQSGTLEREIDAWLTTVQVPAWLVPVLPAGWGDSPELARGGLAEIAAKLDAVEAQLWAAGQDAALGALKFAGDQLPGILQTAVEVSVDSIIFLFAVVTLFVEGPRVLDLVRKISPIEDRYEDHLFQVFAELSRNLVVGSVATAGIQGVIAGIGYAAVGMENVLFLSILTAIGSFVPVVGTIVIWLPVVFYLVSQGAWGWAIFLALWCLVLVGAIDNVLKPLFMRGKSNIHPLLVFLAVFGGLATMNVAGLLVGPVLVAFFLALYQMYVEDFLGEVPQTPPPPKMPWWERRLREVFLGVLAKPASLAAVSPVEGATSPGRPGTDAPTEPATTAPHQP
jgi:predicted PurR-regulated permease PerM